MSLLSFFTDVDEQERGEKLDAQLAAMNARDYGPGGKYYTEKNWAVVQEHLAASQTGDLENEVNSAFFEGLNDGAKNVSSGIGGFLSKIFNLIPWQLWVVGTIVIFIYVGGIGLITRKGSKA